jgi:hypothetical protein
MVGANGFEPWGLAHTVPVAETVGQCFVHPDQRAFHFSSLGDGDAATLERFRVESRPCFGIQSSPRTELDLLQLGFIMGV